MPHYRNGQEAKLGDLVISAPENSTHALGILVSISPGASSCNGQLLPVARKWAGSPSWLPVLPVYQDYITLKDCMPVGADTADPPSAAAA